MDRITVAIASLDGSETTACLNMLRPYANIAVLVRTERGDALVSSMRHLKPRILLLRIELCTDSDTCLLQTLRRECPETLVLLLAHHSIRRDQLAQAVAIGARGYLDQHDIERRLANAVRLLDGGEAWVPRKMLGTIMEMAFPDRSVTPAIDATHPD